MQKIVSVYFDSKNKSCELQNQSDFKNRIFLNLYNVNVMKLIMYTKVIGVEDYGLNVWLDWTGFFSTYFSGCDLLRSSMSSSIRFKNA